MKLNMRSVGPATVCVSAVVRTLDNATARLQTNILLVQRVMQYSVSLLHHMYTVTHTCTYVRN